MEKRARDIGTIFGIALVCIGGWLLLGQVFGPFIAPLKGFLNVVSNLAWPLALVFFGVILLMRSKGGAVSTVRLYRSRNDRYLTGVLGGLAARLGVNSTLVRVAYVVIAASSPFLGVIVYALASVLLSEEPLPVAAVAYEVPQAPVA